MEIVEDNRYEAFLNEFKESELSDVKVKLREELKSPLNFLANSPQKGRFAECDDIDVIVADGKFANMPSKSL